MTTASTVRAKLARTRRARAETRIVLHDVPWDVYEALLATSESNAGIRLAYLEGELEIMSPSWEHETDKKMMARLLEAYAEERDIELNGFGSTTFRKRARKHGLEPDECYVLRRLRTKRPARPDLAIEVVHSSWKIDKPSIYAGLGVKELWLWRRGAIEVHVLEGRRYVRRERSALLPQLDLELLASFVGRDDQVRAVKEFRAQLRERR